MAATSSGSPAFNRARSLGGAERRGRSRVPSEPVNATARAVLRQLGPVDLHGVEVVTVCGSHGHDDIGGDRRDDRHAILPEDDANPIQGRAEDLAHFLTTEVTARESEEGDTRRQQGFAFVRVGADSDVLREDHPPALADVG